MARIIAVSGKINAGKDTVVKLIKENWPDNIEWQTKRFADKLKEFVSSMTGIPRHLLDDNDFKKTNLGPEWSILIPIVERYVFEQRGPMTVREALIRVGDGMRNVWHPDCWVNGLFSSLEESSNWLIPDMRYPNEFLRTEKLAGINIRVNRPGIQELDHPSETSLDHQAFQYVLNNSKDINYLQDQVKNIIDDIAARFRKF